MFAILEQFTWLPPSLGKIIIDSCWKSVEWWPQVRNGTWGYKGGVLNRNGVSTWAINSSSTIYVPFGHVQTSNSTTIPQSRGRKVCAIDWWWLNFIISIKLSTLTWHEPETRRPFFTGSCHDSWQEKSDDPKLHGRNSETNWKTQSVEVKSNPSYQKSTMTAKDDLRSTFGFKG